MICSNRPDSIGARERLGTPGALPGGQFLLGCLRTWRGLGHASALAGPNRHTLALHQAASVASLTPKSAAIAVIVTSSVHDRAPPRRLNSSGQSFPTIGLDHSRFPQDHPEISRVQHTGPRSNAVAPTRFPTAAPPAPPPSGVRGASPTVSPGGAVPPPSRSAAHECGRPRCGWATPTPDGLPHNLTLMQPNRSLPFQHTTPILPKINEALRTYARIESVIRIKETR